MGVYQEVEWTSPFAMGGVPRRARLAGSYRAYFPDRLIGRSLEFEGDVAADVADAERAITRLDRDAMALANTEAIALLLVRAEAVASSRIERLVVSPDVTALEVAGNVEAMAFAICTSTEFFSDPRSGRITLASFGPDKTGSVDPRLVRSVPHSFRLRRSMSNHSSRIFANSVTTTRCQPSRRPRSRTLNSRRSIPSSMETVEPVVPSFK